MPELVDIQEGVGVTLQSILARRLAAVFGAGLSMDPPSRLPSAYQLAADVRAKHAAQTGETPFGEDLGEQADYFFDRGELETFFLRRLIDWHAFAGRHNAGHESVADLTLIRALDTVVTTNIDCLIEAAGHHLFGHIESCTSEHELAAVPVDVSPLIKIHGCRTKDLSHTVWTPKQLAVSPLRERVNDLVGVLAHKLLNRDLLILGFATDWDYLNQVLNRAIGEVSPARVIFVDPSSSETLAKKAPALFAVGSKPTVNRFLHIQATGGAFLAALRCAVSKSFIHQILHSGAASFKNVHGTDPTAAAMQVPDVDNEALWLLRRDLEGCKPRAPSLRLQPVNSSRLGLTLLKLKTAGATLEGNCWKHLGKAVRVILSEPRLLNEVKADYAGEEAPIVACDLTIVVGADDVALASDVARADEGATIARGSGTKWMTASDAEEELGL